MHLPKLERRPELDALRGLFLVWMTLTHLPTRFSDFVNQPIGYVTSAEGFVFLSALLVGRLYVRELLQDEPRVRRQLWKRSLKIYGYHLLLLGFAFTVAAAVAVHTHKVALTNLLDFYLAHPACGDSGLHPADLLPAAARHPAHVCHVPFLYSAIAFGVVALWMEEDSGSQRHGWLLAQFGLRDLAHNCHRHRDPSANSAAGDGAFNLFAWQAVWIGGLWLGATSAVGVVPLRKIPAWGAAVAAAVCLFFVGVRHSWLGPHLTQQAMGMWLDKWQIGPLRVLNLLAFMVVFYWLRKYVLRAVAIEPFLTLGKASLHVYCAHLFFVFAGLALLYGEVEQLHGMMAISLVAVTFAVLILVALNEARKRRRSREAKLRQQAEASSIPAREAA